MLGPRLKCFEVGGLFAYALCGQKQQHSEKLTLTVLPLHAGARRSHFLVITGYYISSSAG